MEFEEQLNETNDKLTGMQEVILQYRKQEEALLELLNVYCDRDDDVLLTPLDVHVQLMIPNLRRMRELREVLDDLSRNICQDPEYRESFFGMWIMGLDAQCEKCRSAVNETSVLLQEIVPVLSAAGTYTVGQLKTWKLDEKIRSVVNELVGVSRQIETIKELFEGVLMGYKNEKDQVEKE